VRLLLDAHVSGRVIATALRARGHDVRAVDEERTLDGWDDESLLELASAEDRTTVTFNVRDFARIIGERLAGGGHHAGCLLIVGIDHGEFGLILRVVDAALAGRPDSAAWCDYATWGARASSRTDSRP
jgi:nucleoside-diphosphate-sugar epimerase